jgi:hypothetical protein
LLIAAIASGMVFTPMMGAIADKKGAAMVIPMMGYIQLVMVSPIYVNIYKKYTMDLNHDKELNVIVQASKDLQLEEGIQYRPADSNIETVTGREPE